MRLSKDDRDDIPSGGITADMVAREEGRAAYNRATENAIEIIKLERRVKKLEDALFELNAKLMEKE